LAALPPPQRENGIGLCVQWTPPSVENALTIPRDEPFDQRSCCQAPISWLGSSGLTTSVGSTSALT